MGKLLGSDRFFFIAIILGTLVILLVGVFLLSNNTVDKGEKAFLRREDSQVLGVDDAKVQIVEFADFQCPACGQLYPIMNKVLKEYENKVSLVYRHFPLSNIHPVALEAAQAAEAAGSQGKFKEYYSLLYERQREISRENLLAMAKDVGLNMEQFEEDLKSEKFKLKVLQDFEDGKTLGVDSTPTLFINNQKFVGVLSFETLQGIIEEELKE